MPAEPQSALRGGVDPRLTALTVDKITGFLESPKENALTAQTKAEILELFRQSGDLSAASRAMNVEPWVMRWHLAHDPVFKRAHQRAWEEILDRCEGKLASTGHPVGSIFLLKTRRRAIYGDSVTIDHHSTDISSRIERARALDAELVESEKQYLPAGEITPPPPQ